MRTMRAIALAVTAAALLVSAAAANAAKPMYYVSLGDSLSVGYQPHPPSGYASTTRQGYIDQLFKMERSRFPGLRMYKLGCGGENTFSIYGDSAACSYGASPSQLQAAEAFLRSHRGQIAFVTIDIGGNNVDGCAKGSTVDTGCIFTGLANIKRDVPKIARRLRSAAGAKTQIVAMTYYNPFLQYYLRGGSVNIGLAKLSVGLGDQVNKAITDGFKAGKVKIADVAAAFQSDDMTTLVNLPPFGQVPADVARICQDTWMCAAPPVGPNIHANLAGYRLIAQTFAKQIKAP